MATVDPKLLELLVCPLTKATLKYDKANNRLISEQAGLAYPIIKGVPIMLVDEAEIIDDDKANAYRSFLHKEPS